MVNFLALSPLLLTGGSPTLQDFRDLRANGCEVVINLALPTSPDLIPDEAEQVVALGMQYVSIPVVWEAPTAQNLADFFTAIQACSERKTFVHCILNMRVSAFIYLYRILRLGWTPEKARPDLAEIWEPYEVWEEFITEMLSKKAPLS